MIDPDTDDYRTRISSDLTYFSPENRYSECSWLQSHRPNVRNSGTVRSGESGAPQGDVEAPSGESAAGATGVRIHDRHPVVGEPRRPAEDEQVAGFETHVGVRPAARLGVAEPEQAGIPRLSDTIGALTRSSLS